MVRFVGDSGSFSGNGRHGTAVAGVGFDFLEQAVAALGLGNHRQEGHAETRTADTAEIIGERHGAFHRADQTGKRGVVALPGGTLGGRRYRVFGPHLLHFRTHSLQ